MVYGINFKNNVVGNMRGGWCAVLCVLNDTDTRPAGQMVKLDGDLYQRTSASSPSALFRWATSTKGSETSYGSLSALRSANSTQEASGSEYTGPLSSLPTTSGSTVPSNVAAILGVATGSRVVGPRR